MFKSWWQQSIKYPDPDYQRIKYGVRVLLSVGIAAGVLWVLQVPELFWGAMAAFFLTLSHIGIGFKARTKRLVIAAILCIVASFVGSLSGQIFWVFALVVFVLGATSYHFVRYGIPAFSAVMLPMFLLVLSGTKPVALDVTMLRVIASCYAVMIAFVCNLVIFPYRTRSVLKSIEGSLSYHFIGFFNLVFLSHLTGQFRSQAVIELRQKIFDLLTVMNQHLVYIGDHDLDQRCRNYFFIFAQGYFLARLFYEPKSPDTWLYTKNELEKIRQLTCRLMREWHGKHPEEAMQALRSFLNNMPEHMSEYLALKRALEKVTDAVEVLS